MDNCDFLCRSCHRFFTDHPLAFARWLSDRIGYDRAQCLEVRANSRWDKDYTRVLADLSAQLEQVKEAA